MWNPEKSFPRLLASFCCHLSFKLLCDNFVFDEINAYFADTSNITQWRQARVTENHILLICDDVGRFWRDLGTILKLPTAEVDNIDDESKYNRDRAWKVMKRWLQMKGREATMGILADALEQMKMKNAVEKLIGM